MPLAALIIFSSERGPAGFEDISQPAGGGLGVGSALLLFHWENEGGPWEGGGPHCVPRGAETEVSALPLGRETDFYGFS